MSGCDERILGCGQRRIGPFWQWQSWSRTLPLSASGRLTAAACRGTTSSATASSTMSRNRHSWALDARFGGGSAASLWMRAPRLWMNPLSEPPLWTRTVHVGYIPLPLAWHPGPVASHYQKWVAPLVGTAVLSSSVGDIFIVPMAVDFALRLRVISLRCRRAQLVGEYISRGCARARVKIDSKYCVLPDSRRGFGEGSELGLLSRFRASDRAFHSKTRPAWLGPARSAGSVLAGPFVHR